VLKRILMIALIAGSATAVACKSEVDNKPAATVEEPATTEEADTTAKADGEEAGEEGAAEEGAADAAGRTVAIDTEASKIGFVGAKVTGDHTGGFKEWEGSAMLGEDGTLTGLEFTVDTTSVFTDAEKLTGHLQSEDFFHVEKYPKASFKTTKIEPLEGEGGTHTITGEMDLRGVKKTISFPATVKAEGDTIKANTEFTLKRFDFGIEYKGKADDLIKDEVLMKIDLTIPTKAEG
jgi:polyisoprenoid-binding protein YceI